MKEHNINPVVKRVAIKAECQFTSPALIGGGFGENTDQDVLRRADGKPFLPGSTVAGVLRSVCTEASALFGIGDKHSPLSVFDAEIEGQIIELDGVALEVDNKVARDKKKYDYEAIATGAKFTLRFLLTIRQQDNNFDALLKKVVGALLSNAIAFGAKTKRGFGRVQCQTVTKREFDLKKDNLEMLRQWIDFNWQCEDGWEECKGDSFDDTHETITAKLRLDGSLMIRDIRNVYGEFSEGEKEPDYRHLEVNGKPTILGTSWAGAIRSGLQRLLVEKYQGRALSYLDEVFGYVSEENNASAASLVTVGASTLEIVNKAIDGYRSITRVKIDRFTGGAADGALFTEMPWYGGETTLEMRYQKGRSDIRELLMLALDAIDKGIIQIGGESSVGRGFFRIQSVDIKPTPLQPQKGSLCKELEKAGEPE